MIRRELAERVPGRSAHVRAKAVGDRGPDRRSVRQQRRLRVVRERQLVGRPLEAEARERDAEASRQPARRRRARRERRSRDPCPSRASAIPARERAERCPRDCRLEANDRDAHVKPAPKATNSTCDPSLDASAFDRLVERDRNRRRGGVAVAVDVHVDLVHRNAGVLGRRLDDADVRLVRDEQVDVAAVDASPRRARGRRRRPSSARRA